MGCICSKSAEEEAQPVESLQKPLPVASVVHNKTPNQFVSIKKDESFTVTAPGKPKEGSFSRNNSHSSSSGASSRPKKSGMTQTAPMPQYMEESGPIMHNQSLRTSGPIMHTQSHKMSAQLAPAPSDKKSGPLVQPQTQGKRTEGHVRSATVGLSAGADNELTVEEVHDVDPSGDAIGFSGEHVIAGWPSWLTEVAGEAVHGWLPRRADSFEKLNKVEYLIFLLLSIFQLLHSEAIY
jgi:hypothetical protein